MEVMDLIQMYESEKTSSERTNFNTLYQTSAEWCNPSADNINRISTPGERKSIQRLIDIGIKANRMFTAGMMSHLFPAGKNWVRIISKDKKLMSKDSVTRALSSATKTFISLLEESNFYTAIGASISHAGYIGTLCLYSEGPADEPILFRSHYINEYYFCENYKGKVDIVIREFFLTARQAIQQFGDASPEIIKKEYQNNNNWKKQYKFIHVVMPRGSYKLGSLKKEEKPIAEYYVCLDSKEIIKEGGFDEMPYTIGRFYKNNYEKHGRAPAQEVYSTFPMINRMETSRIRGAERVSNPPWLAPNDGSTRRISNAQGAIIYWNPGNPASKPEQLRPSDNVLINDEMIIKKEQEIMDAFYVPLFNPLADKKNMTAFESGQRIDLSLQFLTPAESRLSKEFIVPILSRAFNILLRKQMFPELEIPELSGQKLDFELIGKASLATRQIELYGTMSALEQTTILGQFKPEAWDNWDADKTTKFIQEVNMTPVDLQVSEDEVNKIREQRAADAQKQEAMEAQLALADSYAKTTKAPEGNSAAQMVMDMSGSE